MKLQNSQLMRNKVTRTFVRRTALIVTHGKSDERSLTAVAVTWDPYYYTIGVIN